MTPSTITPVYGALEHIAQTLDQFPHLTALERADLFSAIDLAPATMPDARAEDADQEQIDTFYEDYFKSAAYAAWKYARLTRLSAPEQLRLPLTLDQAASYEEAPTQSEILRSLDRAARLIKEQNA
jgi:hypothetical protein